MSVLLSILLAALLLAAVAAVLLLGAMLVDFVYTRWPNYIAPGLVVISGVLIIAAMIHPLVKEALKCSTS